MRVSLVILTYNRAEFVKTSMDHNLATAGHPIAEIVWVDNGSTDGVRDVMLAYKPDVCVLNKTNLGVSKGYNRGFALATGDYIVITGCDMLMPLNWLAVFRAYLIAIPNTGVSCMFDTPQTGPVERISGLPCQPRHANGRFFVSRELLQKRIGYYREDLGLYGYEDQEWGWRAMRVCDEEGLLTYAIPGRCTQHLGTQGVFQYDGKDDAQYHAFKAKETKDPAKRQVLLKCRAENFPYFNPYS